MTFAELLAQMSTARADLPVQVRIGRKTYDLSGVDFEDETEVLEDEEPATREKRQIHRVTAAVLRVE